MLSQECFDERCLARVGIRNRPLSLAAAYAGGRLHQWIIEVERERRQARENRMPNWMVAGIEDAQAVSIDALLRLEGELDILRTRLKTQLKILGEVRQGDYEAERPADRGGRGSPRG